MRLFIGIPLDGLKEIFLDDIRSLKRVEGLRATYPASFHLTLKFLGDVREEDVNQIKNMLARVTCPRFSFAIGHAGTFPEGGKPRVIWRGISPPDDVIALHGLIDASLNDQFPIDKAFHPHITLARVKEGADQVGINSWVASTCILSASFSAQGFDLVESVLSPRGPRYETLKFFPLT